MVNFLKESQKKSANHDLQVQQAQELARLKALEEQTIATDYSDTSKNSLKKTLKTGKGRVQSAIESVSQELNSIEDQLNVFIKGKTVKAMEKSYHNEETKRLRKL